MLIVILLICVVIAIVDIVNDISDGGLACAAFMAGVVCLVFIGIAGTNILNSRLCDEKIAMYTEENTKIESQMDELVTGYMKYETDTYGALQGDSSITLVSLYPDLKADTLVQQQIETYVANNNKIKELKEQQINASIWKWWLYFGK